MLHRSVAKAYLDSRQRSAHSVTLSDAVTLEHIEREAY